MGADLDVASLGRLLDGHPRGRLHALGVTGIGLSGVSALFHARGWEVSGCDERPAPAIRAWLEAHGVAVRDGHDASHLDDAPPDLVLRSPAVPPSNEELAAARARAIPVARRGVALAALVNAAPLSVAVCGTHGKTTTSSFTVSLLRALGGDPSWCVGGYTPSMGGVAGIGGNPEAPFVVEADESDGTLADYAPSVSVVTTVDADHMEHFSSFDDLRACFRSALEKTGRAVVYCRDDEGASGVAAGLPRLFGYGFSAEADLRASGLVLAPDRSTFRLSLRGEDLGTVVLPTPGRHNVLNALGAASVALVLGEDPVRVRDALASLSELPGRRFERIPAGDGLEVRSDYSHHPAEIKALVAMARLRSKGRLLAVFQPHRYTRTLALGEQFPAAFRGVDQLLLLPVFAASEAPVPGGRSEDLYRSFRRQAASPAAGEGPVPLPILMADVPSARGWLDRNLRAGDLLLVIGAGDVVSLVRGAPFRAARPLPAPWPFAEADAPLARRTSYRVGGAADLLADVVSEDGLREVLRFAREHGLPVSMLGQGTNRLIPDGGVRGIVLRLAGGPFGDLSFLADDRVEVGCGVAGAAFLASLREKGLGGLEYMAGIPGVLGGWLAMNAGTRDGAIGDRLVSMTLCDQDGTVRACPAAEAGIGYRRCEALADGMTIALKATFRLEKRARMEVMGRMEAARSKRFDFAGLHTAGSVFRNPPGTSAGRLLDEAGCKGLRVGGAYVCERHANIIATEEGATASDVLALSAWMHDRVLARAGVDLKREIRI